MDWNFAIDKHRDALKRVLSALVGMVGLGDGQSAVASRQSGSSQADGIPDCLLPTADCLFLPRHLHRAVLRLLRPAEAAARRLIIVAARDVRITPPESSPVLSPEPVEGSKGGGGVAGMSAEARRAKAEGGGTASPYPARIALPLFDPPRCLPHKRLRASATAMPRISIPGYTAPAPLPVPPAPDDDIDARRLTLRLAALARALDDLPREARRFARWRARQSQATNAQDRNAGRMRRVWPLRGGRPPGFPSNRRRFHPVHQILEDVHGLAFWVLEAPDTS